MPNSHHQLMEHLMEALSLAMCCESQNPPNPITRAALEHAIQDLVEEIRAVNGDVGLTQPFGVADLPRLPAPSTLEA
jgi:hypothetical protein